jgi:hypothetical protein
MASPTLAASAPRDGATHEHESATDRPAPWVLALALAAVLSLAYLIVSPPAGDLAAATYRSELFARVGFALRDNGWYAVHGHYLPGYSLLSPALGALLGVRVVLALSALSASVLFALIAARVFSLAAARAAAAWFAVTFCVGLLSGRVPYDLGFAIGLGAVLAVLDGRTALGLALTVLTSIASPIAGAFLALAGLADALAGGDGVAGAAGRKGDGGRDGLVLGRRGLALAAAALAPIALLTVAFPEGGWEPFAPSVFWWAEAGILLIALLLPQGTLTPRARRAVRIGAGLYALAMAGAFVLRTPVGGNAARLGATLAGPLLVGVLWGNHRMTGKDKDPARPDRSRETRASGAGRFGDASRASVSLNRSRFGQPASGRLRHPLVLLTLAPVLLYWQLETPINDVRALAGDPSVNAAYYAPLRAELHILDRTRPRTIVEVPLTGAHWEAAHLAGHDGVALARGWERQLDTRYGALFYRPGLTAAAYRAWLRENGVVYVALPDVRLDEAGRAEGALIAHGLPYLREVWRSPHWRLYLVNGSAR